MPVRWDLESLARWGFSCEQSESKWCPRSRGSSKAWNEEGFGSPESFDEKLSDSPRRVKANNTAFDSKLPLIESVSAAGKAVPPGGGLSLPTNYGMMSPSSPASETQVV